MSLSSYFHWLISISFQYAFNWYLFSFWLLSFCPFFILIFHYGQHWTIINHSNNQHIRDTNATPTWRYRNVMGILVGIGFRMNKRKGSVVPVNETRNEQKSPSQQQMMSPVEEMSTRASGQECHWNREWTGMSSGQWSSNQPIPLSFLIIIIIIISAISSRWLYHFIWFTAYHVIAISLIIVISLLINISLTFLHINIWEARTSDNEYFNIYLSFLLISRLSLGCLIIINFHWLILISLHYK